MTQLYCVAKHLFSLTMADENPMWNLLTNYAPFAVEQEGEPIFTVDIVESEESILLPEAEHVISDSSDEDMPRIEMYRQQGKILFRVSMWKAAPICMEMLADEHFTHAQVHVFPQEKVNRFPIDNALMLMYAFRTAGMKTLEIHASVTVLDGKAHVFLGRSGTGKSTHSKQWLGCFEGSWLLNDDNPIVRIEDDQVTMYGSPWSGKTPCYKNECAPLAGVVLLKQAPENKVRRLTLPEAYAAMYSSCSGLRILRDQADGLHASVAELVQKVPSFLLENLPNHDAARLCREAIWEN